MSKKVTELRSASSFAGLVALGVDTLKNESVQVPLEFVEQGATAANTAAQNAAAAATAANTAASTIDTKIAGKLSAPIASAPSAAAISSLVGLNSAGESINASPAQIREMTGIDHSILTEQIVPGEFWTGFDGTKKQVYTRTFRFSTLCSMYSPENRATWSTSYTIPGISGIMSVSGTVKRGNGEIIALIPFRDFLFYAEITFANMIYFGGRGDLNEVGKDIVCNIVLKYIK